MVENHIPMLFQDPMVHEANIWDSSMGVILTDSVLKKQLDYTKRFSSPESLLSNHVDWIYSIFPGLLEQSDIPNPWVWSDLTTKVHNVGTDNDATNKFTDWVNNEKTVAYWTGGLEFTRNQYEVSEYLKSKGFKILLGLEPFCYPNEFVKGRGSLSGDAIPLSFWSKYLGEDGFVFSIPRPLPTSEKHREMFYNNLYQHITKGNGHIVVSTKDPFKNEKLNRGPVIEVPDFNYPNTIELYKSYFG